MTSVVVRPEQRIIAYIGLGSNLQQPLEQIRRAFIELHDIPRSRCLQRSPLYRSPPMGPRDQPNYVNAVAALETWLSPQDLLTALQGIEQSHHRVRERHWGARTLDLDLLLYGDRVIASADLEVPHPGLTERAFVLYPLRDIAPQLRVPGHGTVAKLAAACDDRGVVKLQELVTAAVPRQAGD